jgi:two-component system chemotaxis response regulator CheY
MPTKILVVDDSMMVRMQVKRALGADFTVVEAVDGQDALEKQGANPDAVLVICDVNMPKMSGMEYLENRCKDAAMAKVPVVMLTTEGQQGMIARAKELGAIAWLVKPFKPDHLLAVAKKVTEAA